MRRGGRGAPREDARARRDRRREEEGQEVLRSGVAPLQKRGMRNLSEQGLQRCNEHRDSMQEPALAGPLSVRPDGLGTTLG